MQITKDWLFQTLIGKLETRRSPLNIRHVKNRFMSVLLLDFSKPFHSKGFMFLNCRRSPGVFALPAIDDNLNQRKSANVKGK